MLGLSYYDEETKTFTLNYISNNPQIIPIDTQIIKFKFNYYNYDRTIYTNYVKFKTSHDLNITHLIHCDSFNSSVDDLPNSLTHITFGRQFKKKVDNLPNKLTHLVFGEEFNETVDHLPKSLTHLTFGKEFNQLVDHLP
jgi:hypothetical protein